MKNKFEPDSEKWLEDNGFNDNEREKLLELLSKFEKETTTKGKNAHLILAQDTPDKIAAMVTLLETIEDADGKYACFGPEKTIIVPGEARALYSEGMTIQDLERTMFLLDKAKKARGISNPRRRGSAKSGTSVEG